MIAGRLNTIQRNVRTKLTINENEILYTDTIRIKLYVLDPNQNDVILENSVDQALDEVKNIIIYTDEYYGLIVWF